jgi:hypothetical protein
VWVGDEAFSRRAEAPVRTKRAWLTDEDPGQPQHTANVQMCCVGRLNDCPTFHASIECVRPLGVCVGLCWLLAA